MESETEDIERELEILFASDDEKDEQVNKSKKPMKWSEKPTKLLITLRLSREKVFKKPFCKKKKLWSGIAKRMKIVGGYEVTGEECDLKFRNLLQTYKNNKEKEKQSGVDAIKWPYFRMFNDVLANKSAITPSDENTGCSIDEGRENEDRNEIVTNENNLKPRNRKKDKVEQKQDWKEKYFDLKQKFKESKENRKATEWKEKKEIEQKKIAVFSDFNNTLKEYNMIMKNCQRCSCEN